jgi:hypothetical protein
MTVPRVGILSHTPKIAKHTAIHVEKGNTMSSAATTQIGTNRGQVSPKVSGDELFVPASHLLVIDR